VAVGGCAEVCLFSGWLTFARRSLLFKRLVELRKRTFLRMNLFFLLKVYMYCGS
jgi:hypothetical protein